MKCLIHGSFMNDNYGDYLLFDITADAIESIIKSDDIIVDNVDTSYHYYRKINECKVWQGIKDADCAILTGGGYFGAPNKWLYKHYWNVRFVLIHALPFVCFAQKRKPYMIVGLGVGPLNWSVSRRMAKYIFEHAYSVAVRDQESSDYIKSVLKVNREIDVYPDMVMGSGIEKYLCEDNWVREKLINDEKHNMCIHLTTKIKNCREGLAIVVDDIKKYLDKKNSEWNIYFVCDQGGNKQVERQKIIAGMLGIDETHIIHYETPNKLTSFLNEMDLVITDKLHVGIVSTKLGKYVISTAAHPKTERFYKQIGMKSHCVNLNRVKEGQVYNLLDSYTCQCEASDLELIENNSKKNIENIREFLIKHMNGVSND